MEGLCKRSQNLLSSLINHSKMNAISGNKFKVQEDESTSRGIENGN